MNPLENVVFSAIEMGEKLGLSPEEIVIELTSGIREKQNRYKWRKKIEDLQKVTHEATRCKYTGNFLEDFGL